MAGHASSSEPTAHLERYTRVAIALHWAIAALILFNLAFGFFMEGYPPPWRILVVQIHVSAGMTVLILTAARIVWRLTHRPPPLSPTLTTWERHLAHLVHVGVYVLMIVLPLTGWALISANPPAGSAVAVAQARQFQEATAAGRDAPRPFVSGEARFWWTVKLPTVKPVSDMGRTPEGVAPQKAFKKKMMFAHYWGGWAMLALVALHVAGALKHQWLDREPQLARMGVGRFQRADG